VISDTPDLTGKVAIVTGGGRGIGRAIALGLGQAGAKVVPAARTQPEIEAVADEILGAGGEAIARVTDLAKSDEIESLVEAAVQAFGTVDILVNNAARSILMPIMTLREDAFDKVFHTNVKAVFLLSRAVARIMTAKGGGRIVNITTIGTERGGPLMGLYFASKAAVKMLTMCMATEWGPSNILVNAVAPGMTKTDFSKPIWSNPEMHGKLIERVPQGRLAEPEDIVGPVLFLCSDASRYMTGQTIFVDGGSLADT
jgi:2-deoxy-D-gluconate 3-dehydrogenase